MLLDWALDDPRVSSRHPRRRKVDPERAAPSASATSARPRPPPHRRALMPGMLVRDRYSRHSTSNISNGIGRPRSRRPFAARTDGPLGWAASPLGGDATGTPGSLGQRHLFPVAARRLHRRPLASTDRAPTTTTATPRRCARRRPKIDIEPERDGLLAYPSWAGQKSLSVNCPSRRFEDHRFAMNVWLCAAPAPLKRYHLLRRLLEAERRRRLRTDALRLRICRSACRSCCGTRTSTTSMWP